MRVLLHSRLHYNLTFYLLLCLDHKENVVINTNDNGYLRQFLQLKGFCTKLVLSLMEIYTALLLVSYISFYRRFAVHRRPLAQIG